jgi:propanol-preferring alcohol dehydrogenase
MVMKAMILNGVCDLEKENNPLTLTEMQIPVPGDNELLLKVLTCGVCHTELDEIEGRTPPPKFPIVLGHQVVGLVEKIGNSVTTFKPGDKAGVGWIHSCCEKCRFCLSGRENLCKEFEATGRDANGGYAEYMVVKEAFAMKIPGLFSDSEAAPLLCAGAIGYRSLSLTNLIDGHKLGLIGFGASNHLVLKMVKHLYPNAPIFVFARNKKEREFSIELGAAWAGDISDYPPEKLDSIIDTTPAWRPVLEAMKNLEPGGRLVINAIRKENMDKESLLDLDYPDHLWMEKEIKSVANVSRKDIMEFLQIASDMYIRPELQEFDLKHANKALIELKTKKIRGAKVLRLAC